MARFGSVIWRFLFAKIVVGLCIRFTILCTTFKLWLIPGNNSAICLCLDKVSFFNFLSVFNGEINLRKTKGGNFRVKFLSVKFFGLGNTSQTPSVFVCCFSFPSYLGCFGYVRGVTSHFDLGLFVVDVA